MAETRRVSEQADPSALISVPSAAGLYEFLT